MENLQSINLQSINIHGKQYIPVNERIKYFRSSDTYKDWSIETDIVSMTDTSVIMKTFIKDPSGRVVATGYSAEDRNASQINATSMIENAETSAVGRALGMLGIGIDTSVASADEVNNALAKQNNTNNNHQNTTNNYQQKQDEIVSLLYGSDNIQWKKCFSKAKQQYFWALVNDSDINITGKKYMSDSEMQSYLG